MPGSGNKAKWGDQVDDEHDGDDSLKSQVIGPDKDGVKKYIEYRTVDGKTEKVTKLYRVQKVLRQVSKDVIRRKTWAKFGQCKGVKAGPESGFTNVGDEVFLMLTSKSKTLDVPESDDKDLKKKLEGKQIVQCRRCKGDHWTNKCPYKDTLGDVIPLEDERVDDGGSGTATPTSSRVGNSDKYVPPSQRGDATARGAGESMNRPGRDDNATIRITNLSEDTREQDLQDLCRRFGQIARIYLAKDKITQQSKGFAFINFVRREDAQSAMTALKGFGYANLILHVEWAKPSNN